MGQRPIKFRAWDGKQMHLDPYSIEWLNDGSYIINEDLWIDASGIMQYTGLKDKDGREIYEGDVIDSGGKRGSDGSAILYAVKWNDEAMGFDLQQLGSYCMTGGVDAKKVVVIGNICENPELLTP